VNQAFALLLVAGGAMGARKGSRASLLAALAVAAAHAEAATTKAVCGRVLAARTELLLAAIMGLRYLISGKFMPSGLVAILSFVMYRYNMKDVEK
jgi:uncharacterized membrane protein (UPF0136 family)